MKKIGLLLILFFTSCVGTIEEEIPEFTQSTEVATNPNFFFTGLESSADIIPIAHDKVLLKFYPAIGGSGNFSYRVYINSDLTSPAASLSSGQISDVDANGQLRMTVHNLSLGSRYSFIVRAYDLISGVEDLNYSQFATRTFAYHVPDFDGIDGVAQSSGIPGETELQLSWLKAVKPINDSVGFQNLNPAGYNIYYVSDTSSGGVTNLYSSNLVSGINNVIVRTVSSASSVSSTVSGLLKQNKYHFLVRAFDQDGNEDKNQNVLSETTLGTQDISFDGISSLVSDDSSCISPRVTIGWEPGSGGFDRYYVVMRANSSFLSTDVDPRTSTSSDYTITEVFNTNNLEATIRTGLSFGTTYYFNTYACNSGDITVTCRSGETQSVTPLKVDASFTNKNSIDFENRVLRDVDLKFHVSDTGCYKTMNVYVSDSENDFDVNKYLISSVESDNSTLYFSSSSSRDSRSVSNLTVGRKYYFFAELLNDSDTVISELNKIVEFTGTTIPNYDFVTIAGNNFITCEQSSDSGEFGCSFSVDALDDNTSITDFSKLYTKFAIAFNPNPSNDNSENLGLTDLTCGGSGVDNSCFVDQGGSNFQSVAVLDNIATSSGSIDGNGNLDFTIPWTDSLAPDTIHSVAVIAYSSIPGLSAITTVGSTSTPALQAIHKGWFNIVALGPKIKRNVEIEETMALADIDNEASVLYPRALAVSQTNSFGDKDSSNKGIVVLEWNDFILTSGESFSSYLDNTSSDTVKNRSGYKVFRYESNSSTEIIGNQIFTELTNSDQYIHPTDPGLDVHKLGDESKVFGRFVDYDVVTGDGALEDSSLEDGTYDVTFSDDGSDHSVRTTNSGKAYNYRVKLFYDGKEVQTTQYNQDGVMSSANSLATVSAPKVIVPPRNMALVHPWLVNKSACDIFRRYGGDVNHKSDPLKNFRCPFNGYGHSEDNGSKYYDIGGFLFVDRFEMGISYTRGSSTYSDSSGVTSLITSDSQITQGCRATDGVAVSSDSFYDSTVEGSASGNISDHFFGHPSHARVGNLNNAFAPRTPGSTNEFNGVDSIGLRYTDLSVGDCVGALSPVNLSLEAKQGSVYYQYGLFSRPWIQIDGNSSSQWGQNWQPVSGVQTLSQPRLYANVFTNQAGVFTANKMSFDKFDRICSQRNINVLYGAGNSETSKSYSKKLLSRKEQIAAFDYQPQMSNDSVSNISSTESSNAGANGSCNINNLYGKSREYKGRTSAVDESIRTNNSHLDRAMTLNFFKFIRSNTFSSSAVNFSDSSSYLITSLLNTGTDDLDSNVSFNIYNSSRCVTRFGIQDAYGNASEVLRDKFSCSTDSTYSYLCSSGYTNVSDVTNLITTSAADSPTRNDWLGGDDKYFSLVDYNNYGRASSDGLPTKGALPETNFNNLRDTYIVNMFENSTSTYSQFYNTALGIPLSNDVGSDDLLVRSTGFSYQKARSRHHFFIPAGYVRALGTFNNDAIESSGFMRILAGGNSKSSFTYASNLILGRPSLNLGRWGMQFGSAGPREGLDSRLNDYAGARCGTLVDYDHRDN